MPTGVTHYLRLLPTRDAESLRVDVGNRVLRDVAVVTRGEARGHRMWLDESFLTSVVEAGNATKYGLKSRWTHPGLSSDGLGTMLGRLRNLRRDGDLVRGDLHFGRYADESPNGKLASYVMKLATEDPDAFGLSIVFGRDTEAEKAFRDEHKAEGDEGDFESPDEENEQNFPHARLAALRAADVVDEPAANPNGMFAEGQELPARAERLLEWATGLSDEEPDLFATGGVPPDKIRTFVSNFLVRHNLALTAAIDPDIPLDDDDAERSGDAVEVPVGEPDDEPVAVDFSLLGDALGDAGRLLESLSRWGAEQPGVGVADESPTVAGWDGVEGAIARLPVSGGTPAEAATVQAYFARHYHALGKRAPWERNAASWAVYEQLAADLHARGAATDATLADALRLCGFAEEADATDPPTPIVDLTPDMAVGHGVELPDGVTLHQVFARVEEMLSRKLTAVTGRLPN